MNIRSHGFYTALNRRPANPEKRTGEEIMHDGALSSSSSSSDQQLQQPPLSRVDAYRLLLCTMAALSFAHTCG